MFEYIQKLQQKSREEKRRIALGSALIFTGILFLIWAQAFLFKEDKSAPVSTIEEKGPLTIISESLSQNIGSLKSIFKRGE